MDILFFFSSFFFFEVSMIYSLIYAFAVDILSFHIEEQKDLHRSNMVQGSSILSCKY